MAEPAASSALRKGARGGRIGATPAQAMKSAAKGIKQPRQENDGASRGRGGRGRGGRGGRGGGAPRAPHDENGVEVTLETLEKVEEPDEAAFRADTDELQRKILSIETQVLQCRQQIDQHTADRERFREELKQLTAQRLSAIQAYNVYTEETNQYKSSITNVQLQEINTKKRLEQVKSELGNVTDLSALDTQIAQLEYQLNTQRLPAATQSKIIEEIAALRQKRPIVLQYQRDLLASKNSSFDTKQYESQRDQAHNKAKLAQLERDRIDKAIDELKKKDTRAIAEIKRLIALRRDEQKPLRSLQTEMDRKQKQFDRDVAAYEKYTEKLHKLELKEKHAKEREREHQEYLKRKARREQIAAEREARRLAREAEEQQQMEEEAANFVPLDPLGKEKQLCEDLIRYLVAIGNIKETEVKEPEVKEHTEKKERNADFKGKKVAEFKKKEDISLVD